MSSETCRFGDLFFEPQRNGLTRPKKIRGSGLPMVNMGELFAYPRIKNLEMDLVPVDVKEMHYCLSDGDLLFARQSLVLEGAGQCSIFKGNSLFTVFESHLIRCRLNTERSNPDFYFYFFRSPEGRRLVKTIVEQGAGASGIRGSDLVELQVPRPSKQTQDEIVSVLGSLDDRITLLRETNATLESIAQTLFKSWFVDFDPVRAKMEGREPEGMDADTAALFPDGFEESEFGLVPRGWRVGTLADLATLNPESWTVKTFPKSIKYIDLANTKANEVNEITDYSFNEAPSRARRILRNGDSIIGTVRPGNRSFAYIYQAPDNLTGSTGFAVLRPKISSNTEFLFIAATQDSSIKYLAHVADGGAYPAVRAEVVTGIQTVLPSEIVMGEFHEAVSPIFAKIGENKMQAQILTTLRDILLPRLISGRLRLSGIESQLNDEIFA